jgi:hypothetical protein
LRLKKGKNIKNKMQKEVKRPNQISIKFKNFWGEH